MGWFDTALTVGAGLLGASQGGGSTAETTDKSPWGPAQPYLKDVMGQAQGLYNQTMGMGPFGGAAYAGMNDMQRQALQDRAGFAQQGGQGAQGMFGLGDRYMQAGAGAGGLYEQAGQMAGAGPGDIYQGLQDRFGSGMKAAAGRDISRDLYENQLTGNNLAAADVGGARGSRAGAMEGVMRRGANDRLADMGSQIDMGLMNQAQSQWGSQMQGLGAAGAGLAGLGGQGAGLYGSGYGLGQGAIGDVWGAGGKYQTDQQMQLDAERQKFMDYQQGVWNPLQNYASIAGGMGGQGGTTVQQTPNPGAMQSGMQSAALMQGFLRN